MISDRRWRLLICLVNGLQLVKTQYPMFPMSPPMFPGPPPPPVPMYPMPGPMPIAMPMPVAAVGIPIRTFRLPGKQNDKNNNSDKQKTTKTTTTTTTTTTETPEETSYELPPIPFPLPMPMPMPVQIILPAQPPPAACETGGDQKKRPEGCPPCPPCQCTPSCTPAFFAYCSPCHKQCRCRSRGDPSVVKAYRPLKRMGHGIPPNPVNMPPPPMVVVPFPENHPMELIEERPNPRATSDDSSSLYSSSSEYSYPIVRSSRTRNSRRKRNRKRKLRRHYEVSNNEIGDNDFIKPVLSYISQDGDIKLEKRITKDEAAQLLGDKAFQTVKILAGEDSDNKPRILVSSNDEEKAYPNARRRQVVLRRGASRHVLGEGKKELVFRPPQDKKISNLTVSFQIT